MNNNSIVSDVLFYKQISWEVCALFCGYECLLVVVVRLKIKALEPVLVWLDQSTVLNLDDDAWWALVACKRDSGSSFFLLIILPFLVGEFVYDHSYFIHNILMPFFGNWWGFLSFIKITDALSWHWTVMGSSVGWVRGWGLAGFVPVCGVPSWRLARLATMPFCKNSRHEFMRNSNNLYIQNKMNLLLYSAHNCYLTFKILVNFVFDKKLSKIWC